MFLSLKPITQITLCCATATLLSSGPVRAEGQAGGQQQQQRFAQNNGYAAPIASLQVTGSATRLNIGANRADVQEVLKAVFDQTDKQFTIDHTVTGQVTLRLSAQPLTTILNSICSQVFLRYQVDPKTGIFRFERDEEAVKLAVSRLRALNGLVREQLRFIGLDVPNENVFSYPAPNGYGRTNMQTITPEVKVLAPGGRSDKPKSLSGPGGPQGAARGRAETPEAAYDAAASKAQPRGAGGFGGGGGPSGPEGGTGRRFKSDKEEIAAGAVLDSANGVQGLSGDGYQLFLKDNNYVGLNTQGQQMPVIDLLQQLARQTNVPMIIDPSVPTGRKFRMSANIPARPLPETLNLLAPYARLEWRWVGNSIFVSTTPEFQLFWGEAEEARVAYPASKEQRGRSSLEEQSRSQSRQDKEKKQSKEPPQDKPVKKDE